MRVPGSVKQVVQHGLCIGCGLCESVTGGRVSMRMTEFGALRPFPLDQFTQQEEQVLLASCPGSMVSVPEMGGGCSDPVWGRFLTMKHAWSADDQVRFRSATGGVLTALARYLVDSGKIRFVLQVKASDSEPLVNVSVLSETADEVLDACGSRYSPTAPLTGLHDALSRAEPFAIVAKPCDINAVYALSKLDARVDQWCRYRLALVCGGQSRLTKTQRLLEQFSLNPEAVSRVDYRGNGNPGPTRVVNKSGEAFTTTYNELWSDESSWDLESRCAICPDALGEAADIAAADVWPGGGPVGEDAGFNGVVVRSARGQQLFDDAVVDGVLEAGKTITPEEFNHFQPHQVRKKVALKTRLSALDGAGKPVPATHGLRLDELDGYLDPVDRSNALEGTRRRIKRGRFSESEE